MDRTPNLHDWLAYHGGKGDVWCRDEIVRLYQPLIHKFAHALAKGMESSQVADLRQIGALAVMDLIRVYRIEAASWMTFVYQYLPMKIRRMADNEYIDRMISPPTNLLIKDRTRIKRGEKSHYKLFAATSISGRSIKGSDGEIMTDEEALVMLAPDLVHEDRAEDSILFKQVIEAINDLPSGDAAVVKAYFLNGATLEEIAAEAGVSRQAINTRLAKAMLRLMRQLGEYNGHVNANTRAKHVKSARAAAGH